MAEHVWLNSYPSGVPHTINPEEYPSLVNMFEEAIKRFPDKIAFTNVGQAISYRTFDNLSRDFANYLNHVLKLPPQSRVVIMLPNIFQYPIAMFGILRAGHIVVNANPLYTSKELAHLLKDSEANAILILENFAHVLQAAITQASVKHIIMTEIGDLLGLKGKVINFVVRHVKKMIPAWSLPDVVTFKKAVKLGHSYPYESTVLTHHHIAFLQYTGGTTGIFKGAVLTHRNMVANVLQATAWIRPHLGTLESIDALITALPLYHIFSLTANCLTFFILGITNVLITNPRDIPRFIKELKRQPFSGITGVNTLFSALLHHPDFASVNFSKLRMSLGGGMAVQQKVAKMWASITGCPLIEAYGLTEASPAVCINPFTLTEFNNSIGLPIPSTEVSIRDDEGNEKSLGESGELWVRGPQVMREYWKQPVETRNVLTPEGWLKTGDIAKIDERGYVRLVDRKKDMILVSGFNVYPNEVEDIIALHPKVREVAVVGIIHDNVGEIVKAFIVPSDTSLTAENIIEHCHQYLTNYKIPRQVEFRSELPKTNVGKVLRRALRECKQPTA